MSTNSFADRLAAGKALRAKVSRSSHAAWKPATDRRDPVEVIEESSRGRLPNLIPLRYGRMLRSPFTFLRGTAALMAYDLAGTPATGAQVQACGDCHLLNFGLFATPERNLIFDVRDFDETLLAPWEWDLKRLAASLVVAGRQNGIPDRRLRDVAAASVRSFQVHLREFSQMSPLEVWYYRVNVEDLIARAPHARSKEERERLAAKARRRIGAHIFPKITEEFDGGHRFVEDRPVVARAFDERWQRQVQTGIAAYRETLNEDRRTLFDRYRIEDFALRVVGIGSVATRCYVGLLFCDDKHPLILQVKEARPSVLEPYAGKSPFANQGQRVVEGQRMMQAASDIFLGWLRGAAGHDFYVRQLRDMKLTVSPEEFTAAQFEQYAEKCGWTLARAHAKSGDAAMISGYLGRGDQIATALASFALAYADQTESDFARFTEAVRAGSIQAECESES